VFAEEIRSTDFLEISQGHEWIREKTGLNLIENSFLTPPRYEFSILEIDDIRYLIRLGAISVKDGKYKGAHQETRSKILGLLKMKGDLSSAMLAEELGVSAMAVRQHLRELESTGDVSSTDVRVGKGRPMKRWALTDRANSHFADRHRELVVDLLDEMEGALGSKGFNALLRRRGDSQVESYRERIDRSLPLARQVEALAAIRDQEGYMAEARAEPDGSCFLIENHCPICSAAERCSKLCSIELVVFRLCIDESIEVERVEHILEGSRRCVYRFSRRTAEP